MIDEKDVQQNTLVCKRNMSITSFLCYALIFSYVVFGNAMTFNLGERLPVKISEIVLVVAFVPLFLKEFLLPLLNGGKTLDKPAVLLFAWGAFSFVLSVISTFRYRFAFREFLVGNLYLVRFLITAFTAYLAAGYIKKAGETERTLKFVVFCYFVVGIIGLFQLVFYPIAYDWYSIFWNAGVYFPEADPHISRLVSTYFDPNYLASCLVIPFASLIFLIKKEFERRTEKSLKSIAAYMCLSFFFLIVVFLTKSRSGILGIGALLFFYLSISGVKDGKINFAIYGVLALFCVAAVLLVAFSNVSVFKRIREVFTDPSAAARFDNWRKSFGILADTKYAGFGYNFLGAYLTLGGNDITMASGHGLDSSLLLALVTTGAVGFLIFLAHCFSLLAGFRNKKVFGALVLTSLVICNTNNLLFYGLWVFPFYFIVNFCGDYIKSL